MTETQREPVPRTDESELATATAFLRFARHCVLKKTEGLTEEQLRRPMVGSGTSMLWLVHHLAVGERYWLRHHLLGEDLDLDWDDAFDHLPADRSVDEVLADYREAAESGDAAIAQVGDPDAPMARPVGDRPTAMRWVLAHLTTETTRHAGHADLLRELLDGTTGR